MATSRTGRLAWAEAGRTWLGALGVVIVGVAGGWAAGPPGLVGAAVVAIAWFTLSGPFAVAVGHLLLLAGLPEPSPTVLVLLEAGFVGIIAAPVAREDSWLTGLAVTLVATAVLGGVAWLGWRTWQPRWLIALGLVGLVALALYGTHRYAVATLELKGVAVHE